MVALGTVFAVLMVYMSLLYAISLVVKNNGIADVGYGVAAIVAIFATEWLAPIAAWQLSLLSSLPFAWGVRLAIRIAYKNMGKPEDFRYRAWRESWGSTFLIRSFLQIYVLQGTVVYIVVLPVILAILFPSASIWMPTFYLGVSLWLVGFLFESIGDYQLDRFIRNSANHGKIMMSGLWRYSRHPNYFGESIMWWGITIAAAGMTSYSFAVWVSPVLITYLLLRVSGVPMLEKKWNGNPAWEEYKRKTSMFIPFPPKNR